MMDAHEKRILALHALALSLAIHALAEEAGIDRDGLGKFIGKLARNGIKSYSDAQIDKLIDMYNSKLGEVDAEPYFVSTTDLSEEG